MVEGVVYKDLLPVPAEDPTTREGVATTLTDKPTESHALAIEAATRPEERGAAQVAHGNEVVDLGWNESKQEIPSPLVGGLDNEDLWVLVRRFNKVKITYATPSKQFSDHRIANVPRERDREPAAWWPRSEHS